MELFFPLGVVSTQTWRGREGDPKSTCDVAVKLELFSASFFQFTIKPLDKKIDVFKFNSSKLRVNKLVS